MLKLWLSILLGIFATLEAKGLRYIYLDSPSYIGGAGMFHNFNLVLGCLDLYDLHDYLGLKVDFGDKGLYYDKEYGLNWWNYYFEPINYPPEKVHQGRFVIKYFKDEEKGEIGNATQFYMTRERASFLIERYIHVRPFILDEVKSFYESYLKGSHVIGVHYRGTDKWLEAYPVEYQQVVEAVCQHMQQETKLFVATDEPAFLDAFKEAFPGKVYHTEAQRLEGKPIHYTSNKCFLTGKEALIDCLLLAKSDLLIRTNSNLSTVAAYFNPKMPVVHLNTLCDPLYEGVSRKGKLNELNRRLP